MVILANQMLKYVRQVMDGIDLVPLVRASPALSSGRLEASGAVAGYVPRPKVLGFDCTGGQHTVIDNNMKLISNPGGAPSSWTSPGLALLPARSHMLSAVFHFNSHHMLSVVHAPLR